MSVGFLGLLLLAGLVFLAVIGLVGVLSHPRVREAAKIVFGGLAAIAMLVVLLGGFVFLARQQTARTAVRTERAAVAAKTAQLKALEAKIRAAESEWEILERAATPSAGSLEAAEAERGAGQTKDSDAGVEAGEGKGAAKPAAKELPKEKPAEAESESPPPGEVPVGLSIEKRPEWVGRKPYKESSVFCWPVVTDPRPDEEETFSEALPEAIRAAVREYVQTKLDLESAAAREVALDPDYAMSHLVGGDLWTEPVATSFGPWVRAHALVKFDHEANVVLKERFAAAQVARRLWVAGAVTCALVFLLAVAYCYLKLDLASGGSRRWLLRFAAILVILVSILVTGGLAKMIL